MRKGLRKNFIPHDGNSYIPRFFSERNMLALSALAVVLFFASILQHTVITQTEMRAAIIVPVLIELANADRGVENLNSLTPNPILSEAARKKAEDMAAKGYFSHNSPDGKTPWSFMEEVGYSFTHAGENLAVHFTDSDKLEKAWMDSPGHRANILNSSFTEIGIGMATGEYEGRSTIFVVQMFGKPAPQKEAKETVFVEVQNGQEISLIPEAEVRGESVKVEEVVSSGSVEKAPEVSSGGQLAFVEATPKALIDGVQNVGENISSAFTKTPSIFGRILGSPKTMLQIAYIILASLIGLALLMFIFIEFRQQSPIHIGYSLMVLVLIGGLWFVQENFIFATLAIR